MGAVYKAKDNKTWGIVAVKIVRKELLARPADAKVLKALIIRETQAAGRLDHPNIAKVINAGEDDGIPYIIMEWIDGYTLSEELEGSKQLPFERVSTILKQITSALMAAHAAYIVHRDLKPSNIMFRVQLDVGETLRVMDFGLAKPLQGESGEKSSIFAGTPEYMSPEQIKLEYIDKKADIYSLGVILYEMLTGRLPFVADSVKELYRLHMTAMPPPLQTFRADIPAGVENLVFQMLDKDPAKRPGAKEAYDRFADAVEEEKARKEQEEAERQRQQAEQERQNIVRQLVSEGQRAFEAKNYGLAISKWEEALRRFPNDVALKKQIARARDLNKKEPPPSGNGFPPWVSLWKVTLVVAVLLLVASGVYWVVNKQVINKEGAVVSPPTPLPGLVTLDVESLGELPAQRTVFEVAVSRDGQRVASAGDENMVRLWQVSDHNMLRLEGQARGGQCVAMSPDGETVVSGRDDGTILLWRAGDGSLLSTLPGHKKYVFSVGFSRDGQTLISAGDDGIVRLWQVSDGSPLGDMMMRRPDERVVAINPDLRTFALFSVTGGRVRLWSASDTGLSKVLDGPKYEVSCGAFEASGRFLALGSKDGAVRIYQVSNGSLVRPLSEPNREVDSVAFSPNGQMIATGESDGTIKLWRVSDGSLLKKLGGHSRKVWSVAFSADGRLLASGGEDRTIRLWKITEKIQ